jgi:hypothetical protein
MYALTSKKNRSKSSLVTLQATFHRQRHKIEQLRGQIEVLKKEYEEALLLYHSALKPTEKQAGDLITQFILKMKDLTRDPKALNARERILEKEVLEESVNLVFSLLNPIDIEDEIKTLYKEIYGKSYDDEFKEEISSFAEMFKEDTGITDIDLSNLNSNDSVQEILSKLMQSVDGKMSEHKMNEEAFAPPPPKQKSKKELLKEQKIRDLEALQNKGLNTIYKRLVKELHPDLEQNPEKRIEKEAMMKRLTVAYEKQDLVSLLALESEWLGGVDFASDTLSEESFKAYNGLLKDQIEDLKQEFLMITLDPRYIEIHRYTQELPKKPLEAIETAVSECNTVIGQYSSRLKDLCGENPLKTLKEILSYIKRESDCNDFFEDLNFFDIINQMEDDILPISPKNRKRKKSG